MKPQKSAAELQTIAALDHIEIMISKQQVKIEDAKYMVNTVSKLLYKCEELNKSRAGWRKRAETAEKELKHAK